MNPYSNTKFPNTTNCTPFQALLQSFPIQCLGCYSSQHKRDRMAGMTWLQRKADFSLYVCDFPVALKWRQSVISPKQGGLPRRRGLWILSSRASQSKLSLLVIPIFFPVIMMDIKIQYKLLYIKNWKIKKINYIKILIV